MTSDDEKPSGGLPGESLGRLSSVSGGGGPPTVKMKCISQRDGHACLGISTYLESLFISWDTRPPMSENDLATQHVTEESDSNYVLCNAEPFPKLTF